MVTTKVPFGAIAESQIESVQFSAVYNKYFLRDKYGSRIEIEKDVYESLKRKGYKECPLI